MKSFKAHVIRLLPKNQFARGVSLLVGGTAGSQLLMVLAAPLLTRFYGPDDFGLLAVYGGLLGVFAVVASLRYELAIPLPEDEQEAAHVVVLSLGVVVGMTALSALIVWFAGDFIAHRLGVPRLAGFLWLLPVGVALMGTYQVFSFWAIRTKQFSTIARTRIRQTLTTLAIQILGVKAGGITLLFGHAGGQGMGSITLAKSALSRPEFKGISWYGICRVAARYRKFPLFSTWGGVFNVAGQQLPPLMFAALFSASAAGLYALALRVLAIPMSIVGQAIGNVFFSNAAEAYREGRLGSLVISVHDKLAHVAMPMALILIVAGPQLFTVVFGDQWEMAGEFARWMAPWLYITFITSPLSTLFSVMEEQRQGLVFQVVLLMVRVMAIGIGAWLNDLMLSVILFSLVSTLCWIGFLIWIIIKSDNPVSTLIKPTLLALAVSLVCVLPVVLALWLVNGTDLWMWALPVTGALVAARYWTLFRKAYQ